MDATAIPGAVCASHPGEPITFTCERCGGFACERCRAISGGARCAECTARAGGQRISAEVLLGRGFKLPITAFRALWPFVLIQIAVAVAVGIYTVKFLGSAQELAKKIAAADPTDVLHVALQALRSLAWPIVLMSLLGLVTNAFFESSCIAVFVDAENDRRRAFGQYAWDGVRGLLTVLFCNFWRGLAALLAFCFCCVPSIPVYLLLAFAETVSLIDKQGAFHGLGRSVRLARKRFWLALGVEAVAFLLLSGSSGAAGGASSAMRLLGPGGTVAGALLVGLVGALATLPLFAVNVAFVLRSRRADAAAGIST